MSDLRYNELSKEIKKISKRCCCASGSIEAGCCYEEVTYAEAAAKIAANTLVKGKMYKITDRGDLGIFLEAISENQFNQEGSRLMLIPNWTVFRPSSSIGIWIEGGGYTQDVDKVVWNGLVWLNISGNNTGEPYEGSPDWQIISKTSFVNDEYLPKWFGVIFDFENDWITKQWDEYNNVVGVIPSGNINPADLTDWWIAETMFTVDPYGTILFFNNNAPSGIYNNSGGGNDQYFVHDNIIIGEISGNVSGVIRWNINLGSISTNTCSNIIYNSNIGAITNNDIAFFGWEISYNTNLGNIESNTNVGSISYNSNNGTILGNSNLGGILHNKNKGDISDNSNNFDDIPDSGLIAYNVNNGMIFGNSHLGNIVNNANNGDITDCDSGVSQCNIYDNVNNGDISNTFVADVFDAAVNK